MARGLTYCVSCRAQTGNNNRRIQKFDTRSGPRYRLLSTCSRCKKAKSGFVKASEVRKMGNGVFDWLPGAISGVVKTAADVAVPLAGAALGRRIGGLF